MREDHVRVGVKGERQWRKEIGGGGRVGNDRREKDGRDREERNKKVEDLEGRK